MNRQNEGKPPYKEMRLLIATPTSGRPTNEMMTCLVNTVAWMYCNPVAEDFGTQFVNINSCNLPDQRDRIVDMFLSAPTKFTHLLFVDSDMQFHPNVWNMLAERKLPICAVNYTFRKMPPIYTAVKQETPEVRRLWSGPGAPPLEACVNIGFGFMLIERRVLESITKPRFLFEFVEWPEGTSEEITGPSPVGYHATEDRYFCKKVIDAGWTIWCDNAASQLVRHSGSFPYGEAVPYLPELYGPDTRDPIIVGPDGRPATEGSKLIVPNIVVKEK